MNAEFVLDTSALIDIAGIELGEFSSARGMVTAITVAELAYGVSITDPVQRLARSERLRDVLEHYDILPFDTTAAQYYGTLVELVHLAGRSPRSRRFDLQIAAIAAARALPLLTRNPKDFEGLGRAVTVVAV